LNWIDNTLPTAVLSFRSNNSFSHVIAASSDLVTLTFSTSKPLIVALCNVTIAQTLVPIVYSGVGNVYNASRSMLPTDTQGIIPFTLEFIDIYGNIGVPLDNTAPSLDMNVTFGM
jgi:hypothetical protein